MSTTDTSDARGSTDPCIQYDANVDDMDPRLWPRALDQLLDAGALDAWITPIIMKKGRPAFMLSALCRPDSAEPVRTAIFRETSTIGVRETTVRRHALDREEAQIEVEGRTIGVKTAFLDRQPINRSVEWDDVVAAATALGLSAKDVLAAATAASVERSTADTPLVDQ